MMVTHAIRLTVRKLASRLDLISGLVYRARVPLPPFRFQRLDGPHEPFDFATARVEASPEIANNHYWGGQDINFVLHGAFTVPPTLVEHAAEPSGTSLALLLPLGEAGTFSHPEGLIYIDRAPYAAVDRHHQEIRLDATYCDNARHELTIHGWTGMIDGTLLGGLGEAGKQLFMRECAIVQVDAPTREFVALARTALSAATLLPDLDPVKARLINALDAAFKLLDLREPFGSDFYASIPPALQVLHAGIVAAGPAQDNAIIAIGHAHIDVTWLWTLAQTRGKVARTFHTVLHLMAQFPDFHFTQSQPQLYDFIRQDHPALFEAIKTRVREGRWEVIGGMWIEADCNITGGESLARQFLLGRSFFREHFGEGVESPVLWLPDVFGYAWNMPQLLKLAGMEYFFTIKIGQNQYNQMPYDSFWWQGLDGTRVLTHFSTAPDRPWGDGDPNLFNTATYNADLSAFTAYGSWAKLKHKEAQRTMLISYGYGDGGGGPTREMNENAAVLRNFPAMPRVQQGRVIDFFHRLEAESGANLPTWNAELYLETHRGTYTTQSRTKRNNRKSEFRLHDAEFMATLAYLLHPTLAYPHAAFRQAWELVCLNQFHDIIPGSSIQAVYIDSQAQYDEVATITSHGQAQAQDAIRERVGGDVVLINPSGFHRADLAEWSGQLPAGQRFEGAVHTQVTETGTLIATELAPYSVVPLRMVAGHVTPVDFGLTISPTHIENALLRVEFNATGDITRIYAKQAQREVLPSGALANQWQAFEDRPLIFDAWDIDAFYDDKLFLAAPAQAITVVEHGPLRATLQLDRRILSSTYTQRISLCYNSPRLDFETRIDWRERHILLKAAFPVEILAPTATHEVHWGNVQRPTHRNTSWDWARFETCAQKWVDLSEGSYGVALLNDCKYGHDIHGNVMRITLLRAPTYPDPEADQGWQQFTYSLFPHVNSAGAGLSNHAVAAPAYSLNDPLLALTGTGRDPHPLPALITAPPQVIVETIKQAEDGRGIIVRLYECDRTRGEIALHVGFPLQVAMVTNLLEADQTVLEVVDQTTVVVAVKPFQILTIRLIPQ